MPEQLNIKVGMVGGGLDANGKPKKPFRRKLQWTDVERIIKKMGYDDYLEQGLLKMAGKYPCGAYERFIEKIHEHATQISQRQRQERKALYDGEEGLAEGASEDKTVQADEDEAPARGSDEDRSG